MNENEYLRECMKQLGKKLRTMTSKSKKQKPKSTRSKNSLLKREIQSQANKPKSKSRKTRNPTVLTTKEAAEILGLSPRTLDNWRYLGKGPQSFKLSRLVKYRKIEILKFLEQCENKYER